MDLNKITSFCKKNLYYHLHDRFLDDCIQFVCLRCLEYKEKTGREGDYHHHICEFYRQAGLSKRSKKMDIALLKTEDFIEDSICDEKENSNDLFDVDVLKEISKNISTRELKVAKHLAEGESLKNIAKILNVTSSAISQNISSIKKKLSQFDSIDDVAEFNACKGFCFSEIINWLNISKGAKRWITRVLCNQEIK